MKTIGIDIGGTKMLGVVFDHSTKKIVRTDTQPTTDVKALIQMIAALDPFATPKTAIGLSFAGLVQNNIVFAKPHLRQFPQRLAAQLAKRIKRRVIAENDVACYGKTERALGYFKHADVGVFLAFGSGIGGALHIAGKNFRGAHGFAAEAGHMIIAHPAASTARSFEDLAAKKFFADRDIEDPIEAEEEARNGNPDAIRLYHELGANVGIGLINIIHLIDPEIIVIGGGLAHAFDLFMPRARTTIKAHAINPKYWKVKIVQSTYYRNGAAIGAALLTAPKNRK